MKKMDTMSIIVFSIIGLVFAWVIISMFNVTACQFDGGTDSAWNLFNVVIELGEAIHD